jgi:trans-o-hydroxybenzylidenepyruvate hydratase-aldolase
VLTKDDVKGLCVMVPTPCLEGAEGWDAENSVDLEEAARMTETYIQAGVGSIAACGTTGECAALLWEEKRDFIDTIVQVARKRVPIFAGATSLGTKETIRQMRGLQAVGADGAFVGLPLWQTPTIQNAVQWFRHVGEAVPDMGIMIYANQNFFKSVFPTPFWAGIGREAKTVVITKMSYSVANLMEDSRVAPQVNFMPGEGNMYTAYRMMRGSDRPVTTIWSSASAGMGPEPMVTLADAILRDDEKRASEIWEDIRAIPPLQARRPPGTFAELNAQCNRWAANGADYLKPSATRVPYLLDDMPEHWRQQAEEYAKAWTELRKKYMKAPIN